MHAFTLSLLLLPTALAYGHRYGPGYGHKVHHHSLSGSAVSSGAPLPSTVTNAPYNMGNTTSVFGSTGLVTVISAASSVIAPGSSDLAGIGGSSVAFTSSVDAVGHAGSPGGSTSCNSGVVTVTENPIVTVTVNPEEGSTTEVLPSSTTVAPVSSQTSVFSAIASLTESSTAPSTTSSTPAVLETSSPEAPTIPASTPEATSTSAVEATVASPSESPSSSLSTVTVIPIPATTAVPESTTPTTEPTTSSASQTSEKQVSATVIASSAASEGTDKASSDIASPGGCPGKRGIIATAGGTPQTFDQGNISLAFADEPNICWIANWYSAPPPHWNSKKEFIPQYYGISSTAAEWKDNADQAVKKGIKTFLSFGEPEAPGRDHLEPQAAVNLYMERMQPYAKDHGIKLCSPAVLQPREHMDWLASFMDKCKTAGCIIDMVCVHWYDTTSKATPGFPEFKRTVENATALAGGRKIWVDNFQANGSPEDVKTFLDEAIPYLEGNPNVERYAYVPPLRTDPCKAGTCTGYRTDQFIDPNLSSNGTLTTLGKYYSNFKMGV